LVLRSLASDGKHEERVATEGKNKSF